MGDEDISSTQGCLSSCHLNENSEERHQYTPCHHSTGLTPHPQMKDERTHGNPASPDRAKSGWVVVCAINIHSFNRDMIYLSHSNNAVLSLGICSNLKYIHSISFNNIIGWFCIFSNIQVICFHPSYWFTKSNIFHYWEVIQTFRNKRKRLNITAGPSVPCVPCNIYTSPTPTPETCNWSRPHLHKLLTEGTRAWSSHRNIHFTVGECPFHSSSLLLLPHRDILCWQTQILSSFQHCRTYLLIWIFYWQGVTIQPRNFGFHSTKKLV